MTSTGLHFGGFGDGRNCSEAGTAGCRVTRWSGCYADLVKRVAIASLPNENSTLESRLETSIARSA